MSSAKIAFLIQAHAEPATLRRLAEALSAPFAEVFVHIDAKVAIAPFREAMKDFERVTFIAGRVRVYWGGWSQVEATLQLIEAAREKGGYARYALLSGACYPTRSNSELLDFLGSAPYEYISACRMPNAATHKSLARLTKRWSEGAYREPGAKAQVLRVANRLARHLPDRDIHRVLGDWVPFAGGNWWVLTSDAIRYVTATLAARPDLVSFFKTTLMPDECVFQTVLANSPFGERLRPSLTYADWSRADERPCTLDESHLGILCDRSYIWSNASGSGPIFFARKVGQRNSEIVERIERHRASAAK